MWVRELGNLLDQLFDTRRQAAVLLHFLWHYTFSSFYRHILFKTAVRMFSASATGRKQRFLPKLRPLTWVMALLVQAKCRREDFLKLFSFTQVHVNATWQAGVKAAYCSHNVDTLEVVRAVLFEDRCVLYSILVGTGCAIDVTYAAIPGRRRIGMVVGDLPVLNDHVMGKHAAHGLVWPACISASAFSTQCSATAAEYAWKYVRARLRSIALLHCGIFHSYSTSGFRAVLGSRILTLCPVALT